MLHLARGAQWRGSALFRPRARCAPLVQGARLGGKVRNALRATRHAAHLREEWRFCAAPRHAAHPAGRSFGRSRAAHHAPLGHIPGCNRSRYALWAERSEAAEGFGAVLCFSAYPVRTAHCALHTPHSIFLRLHGQRGGSCNSTRPGGTPGWGKRRPRVPSEQNVNSALRTALRTIRNRNAPHGSRETPIVSPPERSAPLSLAFVVACYLPALRTHPATFCRIARLARL